MTQSQRATGRLPDGYQYRLPTKAEWEYCCRAGTTTEWNVGSSLSPSQACFGSGESVNVGSYAANAWSLHHMHGNVLEWCLDAWDGSANYQGSPVSDPYVSSGPYRVFRGGAWGSVADSCRSANRNWHHPASRKNHAGFRVVLAPILVP